MKTPKTFYTIYSRELLAPALPYSFASLTEARKEARRLEEWEAKHLPEDCQYGYEIHVNF